MLPSKRHKKEDSYHNDTDSHSSKVYIIKLVPEKRTNDQSHMQNEISNYDCAANTTTDECAENTAADEIDPHSSFCQSVTYDEIVDDSSSPTEQMQSDDTDSDLDNYGTQYTSALDDSDKSSFNARFKASFEDSSDIQDMLNVVDKKITAPDNPKKRRGLCVTHKLKFQQSWLNEFPFIQYDEENNLMFCKCCRKYVNDWRKNSPFVVGNRNFRVSMLKYHEGSSMHTESQELADTLASEGIEVDDRDLYKEQLSHVFKSVYFIFKTKMPYTHYPQLCESLKREGIDFTVYTSHLKVVPLFGKFICMAFEKEVAKKLENVTEFSLIVDASFRRNIESHDLVYLKYLDNFVVKTAFLGVIDSSAKLHDSIFSILNDLFKKYGVTSWVDKIVYIMTDKSDNHMWLEGLIELIRSMAPKMFFSSVTYLSHKIKYCASVVQNHQISSTFDALLWSIYCYYEKVDKSKKNLMHMNKELDNIVERYGNLPKNSYTTLYYDALIAIEKDYGGFVQLLESDQLMLQHDTKARKSGARILSVITRTRFLCKLALFIDIFSCLNEFAAKLSSEDFLPYDVHILLDEVCRDIETAAAAESSKSMEIGEELCATPCCFRGVEVVEDGNIKNVLPEIKTFSQDVISYLKSLIEDDSLLEKCFIFNTGMWPEDEEIEAYGDEEFIEILRKFNTDIKPFDIDHALTEWKIFKDRVLSLMPAKVRKNSKSVLLKMVSVYESEFPYITGLLRKILLLNFESTEIMRGYHEMCLNKSFSRSMLSLQSLQTSMMVSMYGPSLIEFDFSLAMQLFLNSRHRKFRKKIIDKKLLFF